MPGELAKVRKQHRPASNRKTQLHAGAPGMPTPGTQAGQRRSLFCLPAMVVRQHTTRDFSSCTLLESRTHSSNLPVEGLSQARTAGLHARRGRRRDESSVSKVRSSYKVGHPLRFVTAQLGPNILSPSRIMHYDKTLWQR